MRAAFGKVNTLHNHVLPWTDRPLVTQNLVGGEDGIDDAGISVARLIPNPWIFLEATGQVFRGDSGGDLLSSRASPAISAMSVTCAAIRTSPSRPTSISASRTRRATTSSAVNTTLGSLKTQLSASMRRSGGGRCSARSTTRSSDAPNGSGAGASSRADCRVLIGFYVSGDYQFARRWFAGARFDRSGHADRRLARRYGRLVRRHLLAERVQPGAGQYRRTNYATAVDDRPNELLFQFQFSIGAHGAHPF